MDLDGLGVELKAVLLVGQKLLDIFALITLELDHLAHFGVVDNGAIASYTNKKTKIRTSSFHARTANMLLRVPGDQHTEFLLDDLENLLLVKLLGKTLDRGQGLTSIALYKGPRLEGDVR